MCKTIPPCIGWRDRHDGSAFAADLAPPPPPVPVFTWTGVYLGGQIGYAWGKDNVSWPEPPMILIWPAVHWRGSARRHRRRHLGYNIQPNPGLCSA